MERWKQVALAIVMLLAAGCTSAPKPAPEPAVAPLTRDEHYHKNCETSQLAFPT